MFWPKDWLPNEAGFKHVRIHSFGYNSDWTTRKDSRLTVHDFGQGLLADLHNSPYLRRNRNVSWPPAFMYLLLMANSDLDTDCVRSP